MNEANNSLTRPVHLQRVYWPQACALAEWLKANCRPRKTFYRARGVYGFKHDVERFFGPDTQIYVPHQTFAVAALLAGFKIKQTTSPKNKHWIDNYHTNMVVFNDEKNNTTSALWINPKARPDDELSLRLLEASNGSRRAFLNKVVTNPADGI